MIMNEQRIPGGVHKGRAIAGSEQYGTSSGGHDQIVVDLSLTELGEQVSTFLIFSDASAPYSIQRLRACGWQGDDLSNLAGIDANDVDVEVRYEMYDSKQQMRVQILTGGGRVVLDKPLDDQGKRAFAAKFKGLAVASRAPASPNAKASAADFPFGANEPKQKAGGVKL